MEIQIVTINTWKCDGDYDKRLRILADQLKKMSPQIVACQECFATGNGRVNTLRYLAEELDMYYHFTPARVKLREFNNEMVTSYSGLGVLSTCQLRPYAEFNLPYDHADGERKVQQVVIEIAQKRKLLLTNVHLTHLHNAADLRKRQLNAIAQKTFNKPFDFNIVCGDFNAIPGSEEINFFKARAAAADCYELGQGKQPRVTINNANQPFEVTIDYIFTLPVLETNTYPEYKNSSTVLNTLDNGIYPSDHFGISTTLIAN